MKVEVQLTEQELEIIRLVGSGMKGSAIAMELHLSYSRFYRLLEMLCRKLGVTGKLGLAVWAAKKDLI